eukprot:1156212-Pelagomonas_calceolata.AAC.10
MHTLTHAHAHARTATTTTIIRTTAQTHARTQSLAWRRHNNQADAQCKEQVLVWTAARRKMRETSSAAGTPMA